MVFHIKAKLDWVKQFRVICFKYDYYLHGTNSFPMGTS